jgi:MoaA/NifB/PqqE/SkfB family radical SAM enzyme
MTLVRGEDIQNNSLKFVDVDHYMKTNNELLRLSEKVFSKKYPFRKVKLAAQSVVTDIIYESAINNRMTVPCKAGEKGFVLMADGELLLCEILNIKIGNLRDHNYDALKILNSESVKEEMAKIKSEKCHCTWECFQMINTVFSPSLYPKVAGKVVGNYFKGFRQEAKLTPNLPDSNKVGWRANSLLDK